MELYIEQHMIAIFDQGREHVKFELIVSAEVSLFLML